MDQKFTVPQLLRVFETSPGLYLLLKPDQQFTIAAATDAYLHATLRVREEVQGQPLFDVFPDNPADVAANGVRNLRESLETVIRTKSPHTMPTQKYDIRAAANTAAGLRRALLESDQHAGAGPERRDRVVVARS